MSESTASTENGFHHFTDGLCDTLTDPAAPISQPTKPAVNGQVRDRVSAFLHALSDEGHFSWLGVTQYTDAIGRPRRALYVLGRMDADPRPNGHFDQAHPDLTVAFTDLSRSVEDIVPVDFYFVDEGRLLREANGTPIDELVRGPARAADLRWHANFVD